MTNRESGDAANTALGLLPGQIVLHDRNLLSLIGILLFAFAGSLGMAFNIDAIALTFGVSNALAGTVATTEMGTIAAGTLLFARLAGRLAPRRVYLSGALVIALCSALSIIAPDPYWLIACRAPAGFALGAVVATVMATAGRSHQPERTFGYVNAAVGVMGIGIAYILPRALLLGDWLSLSSDISPLDGLFIVYLLAALLAIGFIPGTPMPPPLPSVSGVRAPLPMQGWVALGGLGLLFFGHALLAIFLVRLGRQAMLEPAQIGNVLMAAGFVGIIAPLLTGYAGSRTRGLWLVALLAGTLLLLANVVAGATQPLPFVLAAPLFAVLPTAIMPLFLGAMAVLDRSGQLAGAHPAFVMIGSALAPIIGGVLSDSGGFANNALAASACLLVGFALMCPALWRADQQRFAARPRVGSVTDR